MEAWFLVGGKLDVMETRRGRGTRAVSCSMGGEGRVGFCPGKMAAKGGGGGGGSSLAPAVLPQASKRALWQGGLAHKFHNAIPHVSLTLRLYSQPATHTASLI